MANLNESYSILDKISKDRKPENNQWYDRVYLCWEDTDFKNPTTFKPIKGFICYRYNSFASADCFIKEENWDVRHTMIPMCKWVPEIFDKYIVNWKLRNMYWLGNHSFGRGYNYHNRECK